MKAYFFGYAFVRLSKLLAVLVAALGIVLSLGHLYQGALEAESLRYETTTELRRAVQNLSERYASTVKFLTDHHVQVAGTVESTLMGGATTRADLQHLKDRIEEVRVASDRLKVATIGNIDQTFQAIEGKLYAHVASLKSGEPTPKQVPTEPSRPKQPQRRQIPAVLYSAGVTESQLGQRLAAIQDAKQFVEVVDAGVEKPENKKLFSNLEASLDSLQELFVKVAAITEAEEDDSPRAPALPKFDPVNAKTLNAEKIANQLAAIRNNVRSAVLSSWMLDESVDTASDLADSEGQKDRLSALAIRRVWLRIFGQVGLALGATAVLAFLTLVMADLAQTMLDTATNTRIIADRQ